MPDGTKFTISGADVAENQNRRRPPTPAVASIGAIGIGADGLQAVNFERIVGMLKGLAGSDTAFQPRRQSSVIVLCHCNPHIFYEVLGAEYFIFMCDMNFMVHKRLLSMVYLDSLVLQRHLGFQNATTYN